VVDGS
jgi:hypothetical protein